MSAYRCILSPPFYLIWSRDIYSENGKPQQQKRVQTQLHSFKLTFRHIEADPLYYSWLFYQQQMQISINLYLLDSQVL